MITFDLHPGEDERRDECMYSRFCWLIQFFRKRKSTPGFNSIASGVCLAIVLLNIYIGICIDADERFIILRI